MARRVLVGLVAAGLALSYAPAYAAVDDPGPGLTCQYTDTTNATTQPGTRSGVLSGGPLVTDGSVTLTCRLQLNVNTHSGGGWIMQVQAHGTGVVTAGPAAVSFGAGPGDVVHLCTEFTDSDGTTYYWDGETGEWSTDPRVACDGAGSIPVGDPSDDPLSRALCSTVAYLPYPLDITPQRLWDILYGLPGEPQDYCANSTGDGEGPESAVAVVGFEGTGVFLAPPGLACAFPTGTLVGRVGSVTCTPTAGRLRVCKEVAAAAVSDPIVPLLDAVPGNTLVNASTTCGATTASATADGWFIPPVALDSELLQSPWASLADGVTCRWDADNPDEDPNYWAAVCAWNTPT